MSLAELKDNVLALPEYERHDFVVWLNRLEQNYGDIPEEALAEMAAESGTKMTAMPLPRIQRGELWIVDLLGLILAV
jgi:hypothetical protein